jgi:hypothetical protein
LDECGLRHERAHFADVEQCDPDHVPPIYAAPPKHGVNLLERECKLRYGEVINCMLSFLLAKPEIWRAMSARCQEATAEFLNSQFDWVKKNCKGVKGVDLPAEPPVK